MYNRARNQHFLFHFTEGRIFGLVGCGKFLHKQHLIMFSKSWTKEPKCTHKERDKSFSGYNYDTSLEVATPLVNTHTYTCTCSSTQCDVTSFQCISFCNSHRCCFFFMSTIRQEQLLVRVVYPGKDDRRNDVHAKILPSFARVMSIRDNKFCQTLDAVKGKQQ